MSPTSVDDLGARVAALEAEVAALKAAQAPPAPDGGAGDALLAAVCLWGIRRDEYITTAKLRDDPDLAALISAVVGHGRGRAMKLGRWLVRHEDCQRDGLRLERAAGRDHNAVRWQARLARGGWVGTP